MPNWMLQPHNYAQAVSPNHYNVAYRRTATYKGIGMHGLGQVACDPTTDPLCGLSANWYSQLTGPMGPNFTQTPSQLLQATQTQGQLFPSTLPTGQQAAAALTQTNWLPWIAGGALLLVVMSMGGRR